MSRERLKALLAEYGRIALWTYFVLFGVVLVGFATAISLGVEIESAKGGAGLLGAAWIATKLTQPLRIGVTLALTPLVARVVRRLRPAPREGQGSRSASG